MTRPKGYRTGHEGAVYGTTGIPKGMLPRILAIAFPEQSPELVLARMQFEGASAAKNEVTAALTLMPFFDGIATSKLARVFSVAFTGYTAQTLLDGLRAGRYTADAINEAIKALPAALK